MKCYLIHTTTGKYVKFIVFKNTALKEHSNLLEVLVIDRTPKEKDFVNTTFFFADNKKEALVIKNKALADCFAHIIDGYIEEIEI